MQDVNGQGNLSQLSRIEVAGLQLASAILLLLKYQQSVSPYTLTFAAHEIISGLLKGQGKQPLFDCSNFDDGKLSLIKKETRMLWNRLKHADREQEDIRWPKPIEVTDMLFLAINDYHNAIDIVPQRLSLYLSWFNACFPHAGNIHPDIVAAHITNSYPNISQKDLPEQLKIGCELIFPASSPGTAG